MVEQQPSRSVHFLADKWRGSARTWLPHSAIPTNHVMALHPTMSSHSLSAWSKKNKTHFNIDRIRLQLITVLEMNSCRIWNCLPVCWEKQKLAVNIIGGDGCLCVVKLAGWHIKSPSTDTSLWKNRAALSGLSQYVLASSVQYVLPSSVTFWWLSLIVSTYSIWHKHCTFFLCKNCQALAFLICKYSLRY